MTVAGWVEIAPLHRGADRADARRRRRTWRAYSAVRSKRSGSSSAPSTACSASTRRAVRTGRATPSSVLIVSALFGVLLYVILRTQGIHPWNPRDLSSGTWDVSFNTTASFLSNTNWQFYGGETTMSYFSQMAGLAVQNFISAGVGIAVLVAFIRALASRSGKEIGVFYVDLTRTILYVLLPISIVVGLVLVSQGVIQTLSGTSRCHRPHRADADVLLRAGRRPGGDQGARHQRRRLLQRQLGDAVREPDVDLELRRDAVDPDHPRRPHRDVRPHGRQPAPGLDGLRRDDERCSSSPSR